MNLSQVMNQIQKSVSYYGVNQITTDVQPQKQKCGHAGIYGHIPQIFFIYFALYGCIFVFFHTVIHKKRNHFSPHFSVSTLLPFHLFPHITLNPNRLIRFLLIAQFEFIDNILSYNFLYHQTPLFHTIVDHPYIFHHR